MYSTRVAGLELSDPFVIASGVLPDVPEVMDRACLQFKPAAITTKTFTLHPIEPHHSPTVVRIGEGCYINAIGLGNPGIEALRPSKCVQIVSVGGTSTEEIVKTSLKAEKYANAIEVNLSSPNRKGYGADVASLLSDVVKTLKSNVRRPIIVKLGPWDNVLSLAGKALEAGADGLTLINTLKGMAVDVEDFKPVLSYRTGGISGRCIHSLAVRVIYEVYKEYTPDVVGVGGVFTLDDALELMAVGARAVGLASVVMERGLGVIGELRASLIQYLERKGLKLGDIIGSAVKR